VFDDSKNESKEEQGVDPLYTTTRNTIRRTETQLGRA
jgi:hypothetical protein